MTVDMDLKQKIKLKIIYQTKIILTHKEPTEQQQRRKMMANCPRLKITEMNKERRQKVKQPWSPWPGLLYSRLLSLVISALGCRRQIHSENETVTIVLKKSFAYSCCWRCSAGVPTTDPGS
jgi:hypothetical protein